MRAIAHDFETTGVKAKTCGVCQSAILVVEIAEDGSWSLKGENVSLHHPGEPIPAGVSGVHGIYDKDVAHLPHFEVTLMDTYASAMDTDPEGVLGYNSNRFDNVIARRVGLPEGLVEIDLYIACKRLLNDNVITRARLTDAYSQLVGGDIANAHDAGADVRMTLDLIQPIMSRYQIETFSEFVKWLQTPYASASARMPFGKNKGVAMASIESGYLRWITTKEDIDEELRMSAQLVLDQRAAHNGN